jgi:hypothetical protein
MFHMANFAKLLFENWFLTEGEPDGIRQNGQKTMMSAYNEKIK